MLRQSQGHVARLGHRQSAWVLKESMSWNYFLGLRWLERHFWSSRRSAYFTKRGEKTLCSSMNRGALCACAHKDVSSQDNFAGCCSCCKLVMYCNLCWWLFTGIVWAQFKVQRKPVGQFLEAHLLHTSKVSAIISKCHGWLVSPVWLRGTKVEATNTDTLAPYPNPDNLSSILFGLAITLWAQWKWDHMNQSILKIWSNVQSHKHHLTLLLVT